MSQSYSYPASSTTTNASIGANGVTAPTSSTEVAGKDGSGNLIPVSVDSSGNVNVNVSSAVLPTGAATEATLAAFSAKSAGSLVPAAFDEVDLTYVPSGNGAGQIATAVYKLATVAVATLTMTYDSSDRLTSTVKT